MNPREQPLDEQDVALAVPSNGASHGVHDDTSSEMNSKYAPKQLALLVPMFVLAALMVTALFLPWATSNSGSQSLADYAAPQPAVIAWSMLAIGTSGTVVALVMLAMGTRRAVHGVAGGGFLYLVGSLIWYGSAILPNVVASGCNSNGGPLCNVPAGTPLLPGSSPSSGFVLAVIASLLVSSFALVSSRALSRRDVPQ